jgi:hypothetical protein
MPAGLSSSAGQKEMLMSIIGKKPAARGLAIKDPLVAPNHGWHRFKTIARKVRMNPETCDAIQGHVSRTDRGITASIRRTFMLVEIEKLPRC